MNGMYVYPDMGEFYADPSITPELPGFAEGLAGGLAGVLFGFFLVVYLIALALAVVMYVFQSIGLYSIAKRRGIHNPWLAWLPLGNLWILGSISDQYQYVAKGRVRSRRKLLLGLMIAVYALEIPYIASALATAFGDATSVGAALMLLFALAMLVLAVVAVVYSYIALYDLYASCEPGNAAVYLVLSILFGIAQPFFIFFSRKKDGGMPPRKATQPVLEIPDQPVETEETFE